MPRLPWWTKAITGFAEQGDSRQPEVLSRTFGQHDPENRFVTLPENDVDLASVKRVILILPAARLILPVWLAKLDRTLCRHFGQCRHRFEFRYSEPP